MYLFRSGKARVAALVAAMVVTAGTYAVVSASGSPDPAAAEPKADQTALNAFPPDGRMLVRTVVPGAPRRDGQVFELSHDGVRSAGDLHCKRVYQSPAGPGICLLLADNGIDYDGVIFDEDYEPRRRIQIDGVPDRARISRDGRYGAYTTFAGSDSQKYFAQSDQFSTNTAIVDMATGEELMSLDYKLAVSRDGEAFAAVSPQYWGITFAGGNRFYATLASGGEHYLVEGRVGGDRVRIVAKGIECPALSPDGTRIAYKRRIGYDVRWRLAVLDLQSGRRTTLAVKRSIDDQPEWLGDDQVVYSDDRDVFTIPADGSGSPRRLAAGATSPAWVEGG